MTSGSTSCPPLPQPSISISRSQMGACDCAWEDMDRACWKERSVCLSLYLCIRSMRVDTFTCMPRGTFGRPHTFHLEALHQSRIAPWRGREGGLGIEQTDGGKERRGERGGRPACAMRGECAGEAEDAKGGKVLLCCLVSLRRSRWRFLCLAAPEKLPLGSSHKGDAEKKNQESSHFHFPSPQSSLFENRHSQKIPLETAGIPKRHLRAEGKAGWPSTGLCPQGLRST